MNRIGPKSRLIPEVNIGLLLPSFAGNPRVDLLLPSRPARHGDLVAGSLLGLWAQSKSGQQRPDTG